MKISEFIAALLCIILLVVIGGSCAELDKQQKAMRAMDQVDMKL